MNTTQQRRPRPKTQSNTNMDHRSPSPKRHDWDGQQQRFSRHTVSLVALLAMLILSSTASRLMSLPLNRIIELRYCQDYYEFHDPALIGDGGFIPEAKCKVTEIQQKLSWMQGALHTATLLCDVIPTIPMGYLIDRLGTRMILFFNVSASGVLLLWIAFVGHFRTIPLEMMLAGPFLAVYGGGCCTLRATALAVTSKLAATESQRSSYMAYVCSIDNVTSLFGPALAAALMLPDLWLPVWTGLILVGCALPLIWLLPQHAASSQETSPLLSHSIVEDGPKEEPKEQRSNRNACVQKYLKIIQSGRSSQLLLIVFFLCGFANSSNSLLSLYITERYGWSFSQTGFLLSLKAAINVFMLVVVVPGYSHFMRREDALLKGLIGSRTAISISLIGAILIATSWKTWTLIAALCISAAGSIMFIFLYSIARNPSFGLMNTGNEGSGFALLVFLQSLGGVVGTPVMAAAWAKALEISSAGRGLPYFISAGVHASALSLMYGVGQ